MRTNHRARRVRTPLAIAVFACALFAPGCGENRTAEEVKRDYALKMLEGFSVGYYDIRAERADPTTYTLYNLTIDSGDAMITAEEAKIIVNAEDATVSMQLFGVIGADAKSGMLMSIEDMQSGAMKLSGSVKN